VGNVRLFLYYISDVPPAF